MEDITFEIHYNKKKETYNCKEDDKIEELLAQFAISQESKLEDFIFNYKGIILKPEKHYQIKLKDSIFEIQKNKNIIIIAIRITPERKKEELIEEKEEDENIHKNIKVNKEYYNDIICPKCLTSAIIDNNNNNNDWNLKILNCENFHYLNNIQYDIFDDFSFYFPDESDKYINKLKKTHKIFLCDGCSMHKKYMTPPDDKLYKCSCGLNICTSCFPGHNLDKHNKKQIDIDNKDYFCFKHEENFIEYCIDCNSNFCKECKELHNSHETINYNNIKPKRDDIKNFEEDLKNQRNILKTFIESIKETFQKMIEGVESYINSYIMIEQTLINRYNNNFINFQLLRNLNNNNLFENKIFDKLKNNKSIVEPYNKFDDFLKNIFKNINNAKAEDKKKKGGQNINENLNEEIIIKYDIKKKNPNNYRVKLFDPIFVQNNEDNISVTINGEKQKSLEEYYVNSKKVDHLDVVLRKTKNVQDMSYMLNNCKDATSVEFMNWNTNLVTSMEAMFQLSSLKDIKGMNNLDTTKLKNIRSMFCKCTEMTNFFKIPENMLQKKNNQIENISMLFNGCRKVEEINTKNWVTNNVKDMSYLFNRCLSLIKIKDIKDLPTINVENMCGMFNCCKALNDTLSITKWNFEKVKDMSIIFQGCEKLNTIELGTAKWNSTELLDISGMFSKCKDLKNIKNLSNFKVDKVTKMIGLFNECRTLKSFPDLKKWNVANVTDIRGMFYSCEQLISVKGIENWGFRKKVVFNNLDNVFDGSKIEGNPIIDSWKNISNKF